MNSPEKDFVFSESVKAGKRIYYFDVKQSKNGENFISITESKKIVEDDDNALQPRFTFEKHKIFLYKEDYDKFIHALDKVVRVAKGEDPAQFETEEPTTDEQSDTTATDPATDVLPENDLKIDIDF